MSDPHNYEFHERLAFSLGVVAETCPDTIISLLPGCVAVRKTPVEIDKTGIDYIATLRRGSEIYIDHKVRSKGCSHFWHGEPEIAVELWSVMPVPGRPGVVGWTLDESKKTHYTLHTFHPDDSCNAYLLPFQLLRVAYYTNFTDWNRLPGGIQNSGTWQSECHFIPVSLVLAEITKAMVNVHDIPPIHP